MKEEKNNKNQNQKGQKEEKRDTTNNKPESQTKGQGQGKNNNRNTRNKNSANQKQWNKGSRHNNNKGGQKPGRKTPADNENKQLDGSSKPTPDNNNVQDPFWYAKDETAIKDFASFPWLEIVGSRIPGTTSDSVPAVLRINYRHTLTTNVNNAGVLDPNSGNYITRSARAFYNTVVQGYSSSVPFEAPDQMMAVIAAASLRALMLEGKRVYTVLSYYLLTNRYYAKDIVEGLGFNFSDFAANKANFRAEYNLRVHAMNNTLVVPQKFFLSDRWDFLASNLFTDTTSPDYSSLMAYVLDSTLQFDAVTGKFGTCLKWNTKSTTTKLTVAGFFSMVDTLLNALNDDDVRSIFGSLLRVYTTGDLKQLETIDEESPAMPLSINDVVSATIHNLHWLPTVNSDRYAQMPSAFSLDGNTHYDVPIYQDEVGNVCVYNCVTTTQSMGKMAQDDVLLDMYDHLVSPGNVLDITTNMQIAKYQTNNSYIIYPRSEMVTSLQVYVDVESTAESPILHTIAPLWNGSTYGPIMALSHVDSHPLLPYTPTGSKGITGYLGEIDKYTIIGSDTLMKLHDRTNYNLLMMPENSKSLTK